VDFYAGHVGGKGAAVVAGAHQQRPAPVGGEVGDHRDVVFERRERRQNVRQIAQGALRCRGPVAHVDAVRQIEPSQADRCSAGCGGGEGGVMASRNGSPMATPKPLRRERRSSALRVTIISEGPPWWG